METSSKEKNFISAVVYCYNSSTTIRTFLEGLDNMLDSSFYKHEIIVVNDYSCDDSAKIIREFKSQSTRAVISLVNMSYHHGLEAAMNAGVDLSIGDFVFEFDTTIVDYEWEVIMDTYYKSLQGYDIVSACPNTKQKFTSRLFYKVFNYFAKFKYPLRTETFRILSRRAINRVRSITQHPTYRKAAYANCGLALDYMVYKPMNKTDSGKKSLGASSAINYFILYTGAMYRIILLVSFFMAFSAISMGIYTIVQSFLGGFVDAWAKISMFVAFCFSGLFAILSMVIKYLQTIVFLIFRKKNYIVESLEKLQ